MPERSLNRLRGKILAVAYALNLTLRQQANGAETRAEIAAFLDAMEESMRRSDSVDAAIGVARIRKALLGKPPAVD